MSLWAWLKGRDHSFQKRAITSQLRPNTSCLLATLARVHPTLTTPNGPLKQAPGLRAVGIPKPQLCWFPQKLAWCILPDFAFKVCLANKTIRSLNMEGLSIKLACFVQTGQLHQVHLELQLGLTVQKYNAARGDWADAGSMQHWRCVSDICACPFQHGSRSSRQFNKATYTLTVMLQGQSSEQWKGNKSSSNAIDGHEKKGTLSTPYSRGFPFFCAEPASTQRERQPKQSNLSIYR